MENGLRRDARVAATQDRRKRMLPPGQLGQGLTRDAAEMRFAPKEPFVAINQSLQGLVGRNVEVAIHGFPIIASITWTRMIFVMVAAGNVVA